MSYTIDERNPERQQLLADLLNPPTREIESAALRRAREHQEDSVLVLVKFPDMWMIARR